MAASAHRAREMRRTPEGHTYAEDQRKSVFKQHTMFSLLNPDESAVAEGDTCHIEVGGNFAVGQCEPDESQTHGESSRHIGQIVTFPWNTNTC